MQCLLFFLAVFLRLPATGPFPVRLSGGPNLCVGRVEVFHQGEWGTVCDDDWDMRDVAVVCRELDCGEALSAPPGAWFGEGIGPIWLNEVHCMGTEWHLHSCRHLGFRKHVCTHEEDASAICSAQRFPPFTAFPPLTSGRRADAESETAAMPVSPTPAEGSTALRLVGGRSRCSGRLEVFHQGQWGSVCDDMWDLADVSVVCRELGCGEALAAPGSAFFGEGNNAIWLDDVRCQGKEEMLAECLTSPWGTHNCRHTEDAGAVCSGEMPLAMVEEHLAMLTQTIAPQRSRSTAPVRTPRPTRFIRLWAEPATPETSWHKKKSPTEDPSEEELHGQWQVRLVGGPGSCAGRVEVLYKGRWGTVCDDGWDLVDAAVVCRELGCGAPLLSTGNARYGPGSGPIWLDDVNCTGTESTLRHCRSQPWGQHNCNHHEDASVICTGRWKPLRLPKVASDSNIAERTPDPTTEDPGPVGGPGLQNTFDVTEATMIPQAFPTIWEMELPNKRHPDEPVLTTHNVDLELEQETQSMSPRDIVETTPIPEILQHVQEIKSTSSPEARLLAHQREQEPIYPSVKSHLPHTMQELEFERESEPTNPQDVNEIILNPDILQHVQEMKPTSSPKTSSSTHRWEQVTTFSSTESQPPSAMWDLGSERETEPINPSGTELPTSTQGLKPATEKVLPIHWDNMPELLPITQNKEPTKSSAETQPTSVTWVLEPARETEAVDHVGMKPSLFSDSLEATSKMQLLTITPNVQPLKDLEVASFDVIDSEEIRSLKDQMQQERLNTDSHTVQLTESTFAPNALSSQDGTDARDMTALPPQTMLPTVSEDGLSADGLESSGDTEKGENHTDTVSTPGPTEAPSPSIPSAEPVTQAAKLRKSSPGCPIRQEPREEDQNCCCSPTALGNVVHAMEGLHEELGSLSFAIKHQGSQLEAVAHSLAQLAASVNHLVGVLPGLLQPVPAQPSSVSYRQDESQIQNQLPLK